MTTDYLFVWRKHPVDVARLVPIVRAANGQGHKASDGYDFTANHRAWEEHMNLHLPAWTYFYPKDSGHAVAAALIDAAPNAPFYVLDIEDRGCAATEVRTCFNVLRNRAPVWLSTWGLTRQADENKVPWTAVHWDVISPQKYFAYQDTLGTKWQPHCTRVLPTISPADYSGWRNIARRGPVAVWEANTVDPVHMSQELDKLRLDGGNGSARQAHPNALGFQA